MPVPPARFPRSPLGRSALSIFFMIAEYLLYAVPLLHVHLDLFKRLALVPAGALALENSEFVQVNALLVHALKHSPPGEPQRIMHMNHGFGRSVESYALVLSRFSRTLNATTVAHDSPVSETDEGCEALTRGGSTRPPALDMKAPPAATLLGTWLPLLLTGARVCYASEPPVAFSHTCHHAGRPAFAAKDRGSQQQRHLGGGFSLPRSQPTYVASSSSDTVLSSASNRSGGATAAAAAAAAGGNGIHLRDGSYRRFGWNDRSWKERALVLLSAAALAILRRRLMPVPPAKFPRSPLGRSALSIFFMIAEYLLYAVPLLQVHLDLFKRPALIPAGALALENSEFVQVNALLVHALKHSPPGETQRIMHMNHGFGASAESYALVLSRFSRTLNATTVAHDSPGFGLTGEPPQDPQADMFYSFEYNAVLGKAMVDLEKKKAPAAAGTTDTAPPHVVLLGHSMGSITSSFQALQHLEEQEEESRRGVEGTTSRPTVLVLIAPAIIAMDTSLTLTPTARSVVRTPRILRGIWNMGLRGASLGIMRFFLRSIVYNTPFWAKGLGQAWGPVKKPCGDTIARYRRASLKEGWDRSLARFVLAPVSGWMVPPADDESGQRSRAISEVIRALATRSGQGDLRILIIHGKHDLVIPISNSRKLQRMLPGSTLIEMENCGHVPHEEHPEDFAEYVEAFLKEEV